MRYLASAGMLRAWMLVLLLISLVAVGCGGGVSCFLGGSCPVVIDTEVEADGSSGAFTASGAFCSEGTIESESATSAPRGFQSPDFTDGTYFFRSEMVCADGSGSISLETKVYPLSEPVRTHRREKGSGRFTPEQATTQAAGAASIGSLSTGHAVQRPIPGPW